jgi:hypothetical protein
VEECIDKYKNLSKEVFNIDNVLAGKVPFGDDQCRFDYSALGKTIKNIIKDRLSDENCTMDDVRLAESQACRSFVVAGRAEDINGPPVIFRSYGGEGRVPSKCAIWEAARATTPAPAFFKPIFIKNPPPGKTFIAGLGFSNPSELALAEAQHVWSTSRRFCLVSIGMGRPKTVKFANASKAIKEIGEQRILLQLQRYVPQLATNVSDRGIEKKFLPPGVASCIKMAKANRATDSENVHQRLFRSSSSTSGDKTFVYFRFNLERDDADIGLEEWEKPEKLATHTESYIQSHETEARMNACVTCLMEPP